MKFTFQRRANYLARRGRHTQNMPPLDVGAQYNIIGVCLEYEKITTIFFLFENHAMFAAHF